MKVLGHSLTWPTTCFLRQDCPNPTVFAHTNGFGDFVLFDELGPPWPIHECYLYRFQVTGTAKTGLRISDLRRELYRDFDVPTNTVPKRKLREIEKQNPKDFVAKGKFVIIGYVQDYVENRAKKLTKDSGELGLRMVDTVLRGRSSQVTIVDDQDYSYTAMANLSNVVVSRKDIVGATIQALPILGFGQKEAVFVIDDIFLMRGEH